MSSRLKKIYVLAPLILLIVGTTARTAKANDDTARIGLQLRTKVQVGGDSPALILNPQVPIKSLTISLTANGSKRKTRLRCGRVDRGGQKILSWRQPVGTTAWTAEGNVLYANGERSTFTLTFDSTVYPQVAATIKKSDVDLENYEVSVRLNQPISKVEVIVTGDDGLRMSETTEDYEEEDLFRTSIGWEPKAGVGVLTIDVKIWSIFGFWVSTRITPVEINIPHEDVEFESGKWDVRTSEAPKIDATIGLLKEKLRRYGGLIKLQLYVVGYTDTVGSKASNRDLSEKRARSIATYFRRSGLKLPIYYQGFGEDVLAIKTPDETAESKNRRALYVLAGSAPEPQPSIPKAHWKAL